MKHVKNVDGADSDHDTHRDTRRECDPDPEPETAASSLAIRVHGVDSNRAGITLQCKVTRARTGRVSPVNRMVDEIRPGSHAEKSILPTARFFACPENYQSGQESKPQIKHGSNADEEEEH
jgi:hypothetical protein